VIRPDLADIEPYRWQEGWEGAVPEGVPVLRLDQNTQPRSPRWYAGAAARLAAVPVHSYPDSRYGPLREAIAAYAGFPPEQVIPTDGADEALILCALLPGLESPTVLPLARTGMHAVHAVVDRHQVVELLTPLRAAGASSILVLPIENLVP
jgi:histidinol-phosphate/aromatic aminotransferase/cobyric acid decarboxylase-like protein